MKNITIVYYTQEDIDITVRPNLSQNDIGDAHSLLSSMKGVDHPRYMDSSQGDKIFRVYFHPDIVSAEAIRLVMQKYLLT